MNVLPTQPQRVKFRIHGLSILAAFLALIVSVPALAAGMPARDTSIQTWGGRLEGTLTWSQAQREARFREMQELFPADPVAADAQHVHALPSGKPLTVHWPDATMNVARYMAQYHLAGVMVLQNGRIRLQRYALGFGPHGRWTSFSVAKSFTSVLLGIALQQGYIHSLNDPLEAYIPELAGTAYARVTVRELLTMTSGVRWDESYTDPDSDVAQMYRGACHHNEPHVLAYLKKLPRAWPAGSHWNYNTGEIDLLGILVARATRRPLATYLSQTIWQPDGMASKAYWLKDPCGNVDLGGSGISATLGDYARMGQFMLTGGRIAGHKVIAKAWLNGALHDQEHTDQPGQGYGYLWWIGRDGSYAAYGIFGQMIYVDPARHLVIVQVGAWPTAYGDADVAARDAFVRAVKQSVNAEP